MQGPRRFYFTVFKIKIIITRHKLYRNKTAELVILIVKNTKVKKYINECSYLISMLADFSISFISQYVKKVMKSKP